MNNINRLTRRALGLVALSLAVLTPSLQAQEKPPLKILVGFPPGGSADVLACMVVDNKPGHKRKNGQTEL